MLLCPLLNHELYLLLCQQEKEVKQFREGLKQEMKLVKHEVDILPRDQRKEALKRRKEEKEIEQAEKVRETFSRVAE